jgi:hypothetical protein
MPEETKKDNNDSNEAKAVENSTALAIPPPANPQSSRQLTISSENPLTREFIEFLKIDADVRKQEAEVGKQEVALKEKEVTLKEKEIDHAANYSLEALKAQKADFTEERIENRSQRRDYLIASGIGLVFILGFLVFCLYTGNIEIARQIVQYGGTALLSGLSGYFYGKSKGKAEADQSQ